MQTKLYKILLVSPSARRDNDAVDEHGHHVTDRSALQRALQERGINSENIEITESSRVGETNQYIEGLKSKIKQHEDKWREYIAKKVEVLTNAISDDSNPQRVESEAERLNILKSGLANGQIFSDEMLGALFPENHSRDNELSDYRVSKTFVQSTLEDIAELAQDQSKALEKMREADRNGSSYDAVVIVDHNYSKDRSSADRSGSDLERLISEIPKTSTVLYVGDNAAAAIEAGLQSEQIISDRTPKLHYHITPTGDDEASKTYRDESGGLVSIAGDGNEDIASRPPVERLPETDYQRLAALLDGPPAHLTVDEVRLVADELSTNIRRRQQVQARGFGRGHDGAGG